MPADAGMVGGIDADRPAGLLRRLAACLYDGLVLLAVLMLAGAMWVAVKGAAAPPGDWLFRGYLVAIAGLFFGTFWTRGQTLGMRAWRLRIVAADGRRPRWREALLRFAAAGVSLAALGAGFLWVLIDRDQLAWHDRWSATRLIVVDRRDR